METTDKQHAMKLVAIAQKDQIEAERALWLAVEIAKEQGASWEEIGQALGTTKQAAHARFSKEPPKRR